MSKISLTRAISLFLLLILPMPSPAQYPWSGILPPSRAIDWSHVGVVGGIPVRNTQCGLTVTPSGLYDMTDANAINQALQKCANGTYSCPAPPGCFVQLAAGTFQIVGGLTFGSKVNQNGFTSYVNNVTLKGMGPDQTTLRFITTGMQDCGSQNTSICIIGDQESVWNSYYGYNGACNWTGSPSAGTYTQGSTVITLTGCVSSTGVAVANPPSTGTIILDQRDDDVGLSSCSSVGTTATCVISLNAFPDPVWQVGACVGVGFGGQSIGGQSNYGKISIPGTPTASVGANNQIYGYTTSAKTPQRPPTTCNAITAIGTDSGTGRPTFSFTLTASWAAGGGTGTPPVYPSGHPNSGQLWYPGSNVPASQWGFATIDPGGIYVTSLHGITTDEYVSQGRLCPDPTPVKPPTCQAAEISSRAQEQVVTINHVSGNQVTINEPIRGANWRTSQAPGAYWYDPTVYHHDIGVESLTLDMTSDGGANSSNQGVWLYQCYNCWFRNIRSLNGNRDHIWITDGSSHVTVRDSYFFGTKSGATQAYGIESFDQSGDVLIENNVLIHIVSALMDGGTTGGVRGYNFMTDDAEANGTTGPYIMMSLENISHDTTCWNLWESDNSPSANADNTHGTTCGPITLFRQRERGQSSPLKGNSLYSYLMAAYDRGFNVIGNVLGMPQGLFGANMPGNTVSYQQTWGNGGCNNCAYNNFGLTAEGYQSGSPSPPGPIPDDPVVRKAVIRWGNYDAYTGGVRWCGIGTETGCSVGADPSVGNSEWQTTALPDYPVPSVPANQNLPVSFYLAGKPPFWNTKWGSPGWPAIGPDVTATGPLVSALSLNGTPEDPSGHTYAIPAQIAYLNMPLDPVYQRPNTLTGGSFSSSMSPPAAINGDVPSLGYPGIVLTGTFSMQAGETFTVQGATPSGYNGTYQVHVSDGPNYPNPFSPSVMAGGSMSANVNYAVVTTRVNVNGETQPSVPGYFTTSSTCPTSGNCSALVPAPGQSSGNGLMTASPCCAAQSFNVYMRPTLLQGTNNSGIWCKQNATPLSESAICDSVGHPGLTCAVISTAVITYAANPGACTQPPASNTAYGHTIWTYQPTNPGGNITTPGTMTGPNIQIFNADVDYYGGTPVPQPPTVSMSVSPTSITVGQSALLSWSTNNATTVSITPIGSVAVSGSQSVSPAVTTTYTLTATNANGTNNASATLTVTTTPPGPSATQAITGNGKITGQGKIN